MSWQPDCRPLLMAIGQSRATDLLESLFVRCCNLRRNWTRVDGLHGRGSSGEWTGPAVLQGIIRRTCHLEGAFCFAPESVKYNLQCSIGFAGWCIEKRLNALPPWVVYCCMGNLPHSGILQSRWCDWWAESYERFDWWSPYCLQQFKTRKSL